MKLGESPLSVLMVLTKGAVAVVLAMALPLLSLLAAIKPAAAQPEGTIRSFEQLAPQAQQGIQILTTCSAAYSLFAQRVAKDTTIVQHYAVSSSNLLKMAAQTVGVQVAKQMATHSQEAILRQAESDAPPGLTIAAATQSCNDIVRSTFVDFFK